MSRTTRKQARELFATIQEVHRTIVSKNSRVSSAEAGHDLSMAQMVTLNVVREYGPLSLKDLAAATHVSPASASGMVDRLVDWNLLERAPDPDDRRAIRITLTPVGERAVESMQDAMLRSLENVIERIGPEYAQQWCEVYAAIRARALDNEPQTLAAEPASK